MNPVHKITPYFMKKLFTAASFDLLKVVLMEIRVDFTLMVQCIINADIYLLQSHSTCFGCHSTHHQE